MIKFALAKKNVVEQISIEVLYNNYLNYLSESKSVQDYKHILIGDSVKVIKPVFTGSGGRCTFYGFVIIHAKIVARTTFILYYKVAYVNERTANSKPIPIHDSWRTNSVYGFDTRSTNYGILRDDVVFGLSPQGE